ncbi:MAG: glucosamine-6-phosphate deaminase [Verrucomicrobiales bacterium]|nr:glucosamine-6-phosphate deaminase [Verrucomicrobiales bacterium]
MNIHIDPTPKASGAAAALLGAEKLRSVLATGQDANIIVATGASQFEMLEALIKEQDIEWHRVRIFHLDEYIGIPISHGASFRKYLWERFVSQLPYPPLAFHALNGECDAEAECKRVGELISEIEIDVAFIGIGENGHIAFNDPPADFETQEPYHVVDLDDACRRQQLGEGWFPTFDDVPEQAISMTVSQIMKSRSIICTVPDERKAEAVKNSVEGEVSNLVPASILQNHSDTEHFLDEAAASKLSR